LTAVGYHSPDSL
jgi:hypothetical protein